MAGTNGKGTCATLVASALGACGLRVGLYTSPYVLEFRERFQLDGEMIPQEELVEEVETLAPIADQFEESGDQVTEFEYITALARHWFARRQCDIVVLEVGMGGRFDATNVIDVPEVAAIMSISLDHTAILGSTLEKIAFEKAGIVKAGGRLVLYPDQAPEVTQELEQICQEAARWSCSAPTCPRWRRGSAPSAARPLPWRAPAGGTWRCARPFWGSTR